MSGVWPACTCLVSNDHRAVGSSGVFSLLMGCSPGVMGPVGLGATHSVTTADAGPPPVFWGPVTTDPRLPVAGRATQPGQSPGAPHRGWRVAGQRAGA